MIKETTGLITLVPENIPDELTERPQWVCWRYEERNETLTKVPYIVEKGVRASTTDLMTWRTFEDAVMALHPENFPSLHLPQYDGVGLVFSSADPFCGVDLDDCRDHETGDVAPWAQEIIDRVGDEGYVEVSPSGTGVHIVVKGTVRNGGMRKGKVEMYSRGRFFAFTGRPL